MLFTELPFLDRFAAASDAGFSAVEFLSPYEYPVDAVTTHAYRAGVEVSLFNLPAGDWAGGERGIACVPGREEEFRASIATALNYAKSLGTKSLHAMAGKVPFGADPDICREVLVENLSYAANAVAKEGITLLLEAINTRDIPGFLVNTQAESEEIRRRVGSTNLKLQMDLYHMQVMEGDLAQKLKKYLDVCGHIQIAGCPGRNEPDTGEIRYEYLFRLIDEIGYQGWLGCEYRPAAATVDGLGWLRTAQAEFFV
jgi:hydroxypyruvate isomerase